MKSTIAVSLNNYLDAGAIVAGGSGITLWKEYLGLTEMHLGWINALSANALGAAIGAIIGGFLAQHIEPFEAARLGVYVHGLAGDDAKKERGTYSMMASDIVEHILYGIE